MCHCIKKASHKILLFHVRLLKLFEWKERKDIEQVKNKGEYTHDNDETSKNVLSRVISRDQKCIPLTGTNGNYDNNVGDISTRPLNARDR